MKYLKLMHELYEKQQILLGKNRIAAFISATKEIHSIKSHHNDLLQKYSLGIFDGFAAQYQQNILARKNAKLMIEYEKIVTSRMHARRVDQFKEASQGFFQDITKNSLGIETQQIYGLSESSLKELAEQKWKELSKLEGFKKYTDPKQFIIMVQNYRERFHTIALDYVKLYHESIQNLLEGKREVMQNEQFKFDDGTTVKDRMNKLDAYLRSKMPKFRTKHTPKQ